VSDQETEEQPKLPTRTDLQIPRRLFHMAGGSSIGIVYGLFLTHQRAVHLLGTAACIIYILDQIRVNYPEFARKVAPFMRYLIRAEEQLKESAGVPMVMGFLLTILSFPKPIAIAAIFTLGIADPLSAIVGIKYGRLRLFPNKSLEGSLAFFVSSFIITFLTLFLASTATIPVSLFVAFLAALGVSTFEMLPIKLDDNLTIPLVMGFWFWLLCNLAEIPVL
jgi:dolichol kinase